MKPSSSPQTGYFDKKNKNSNSFLSFSDLSQLLNENIKRGTRLPLKCGNYVASIGSSIQDKVETVADIMKQSQGRDKLCNFIQYVGDFYYVCHKNSNIEGVQHIFKQDGYQSAILAKKIRDSMKSGRKIFKFLKFIGEINNFVKVFKSGKPISLKLTLLLCVACRFFYYVLDNILWGISVGKLSEIFKRDLSQKVRSLKDSFLMFKGFLKISEACYGFLFKRNKEQVALNKLQNVDSDHPIRGEGAIHSACMKVLVAKHKRRLKTVKLITTCLRILMLCKRQDLYPFNRFMNNISYSFFGLACALVGIIKIFNPKVEVIRIEKNSSSALNQEYEELSKKQYQQLIPKQKSLIKRCDSTLSDLLSMGSDDDDDAGDSFDNFSDNQSQDDFDQSDDSDSFSSGGDLGKNLKSSHHYGGNSSTNNNYNGLNSQSNIHRMSQSELYQLEEEEEEYLDNSDGGSVHNFRSKKKQSEPKPVPIISKKSSKKHELSFLGLNAKRIKRSSRSEQILRKLEINQDSNSFLDELNWEIDENDNKEQRKLDKINQIFAGSDVPAKKMKKATAFIHNIDGIQAK